MINARGAKNGWVNSIVHLTTTAQIERIVSAVADAMPWRLPLYTAARDGLIHLVEPTRSANIPKAFLTCAQRPSLIVLGDDDYASTGPHGWASAKRLKYWAGGGVVNAAGGDPVHYSAAVEGCLAYRRMVLVETDHHYRDAWIRFLRPIMPVMVVATRDNAPHPCRPRGGA